MDAGEDGSAPPPPSLPSYFPWERLPDTVQEAILFLLPVSTLIVFTSVSRSLRSTIRSPDFTSSYCQRPRLRDQDVLFLLLNDSREGSVAAYHPSRDRWLHLPIPLGLHNPAASGGSLLMSKANKGHILVSNPLRPARTTAILPRMKTHRYSALALIEFSPSDYMVVSGYRLRSQVYDSRSGSWSQRGNLPSPTFYWTTAYLNGLLYCLGDNADRLLTFDPVGGEWNYLDVTMPAPGALVCSHLMVFDGGLILVSGIRDGRVIIEIGIWEFDLEENLWRVVCFLSNELLSSFSNEYFEVVDGAGKICLYTLFTNHFLMCDLAERRWWWTRCDISHKNTSFQGQALEPQIDLLM